MSKLLCKCGHIIRDQTDQLPYKARFLCDFDDDLVFDKLSGECALLVQSVAAGDRESWLKRHFLDRYPRSLSDGSIFSDFMAGMMTQFFRDMYECENCGRLWIQKSGTLNEFASYVPDSGKLERVLQSPRDERAGTS